MELTYKLEKSHVLDFQKHFLETSKSFAAQVQRTRVLLIILCTAAVAFYYYRFMYSQPAPNWSAFIVPTLVMVVLTTFMVVSRRESLKRRAIKNITLKLEADPARYLGEVTLAWDGQAFTETLNGNQTKTVAADLLAVAQTDKLWLLYRTKAEALIVPKKAVVGNADWGAVLDKLSTTTPATTAQ